LSLNEEGRPIHTLSAFAFSIESTPYGLSYREWSSKWWKWLLSIPKSINPSADSTGAHAYTNQRSDVFFLCQTLESVDVTPHRRVTVRAGQPMFMPIINWLSVLHVDGETDQELIIRAKNRMDVIKDLEIAINDLTIKEGLARYRAQSPVFEAVVPEDNVLGIREGPVRCFSDGFWLFLKPFRNDVNNVKIASFGSCSSGMTRIAVAYEIKIMNY
jgi:hypothetical protein